MQKQMPQYRVLLRDAWSLTKSYKQLWIWGFFASLLGSFGEYEAVGRIINSVSIATGEFNLGDSAFSLFYSRILGSAQLLLDVARNITTVPPQVVLVSIIFVVGALLLLWLSFTAIIALIAETNKLRRSSRITIADGFLASQKYLFPTLVIYGLGRLLMILLGSILILLGLLVLIEPLIGIPILLTGFVFLIPLIFAISFASRFVITGIIVKQRSIYDSIMEATELIKKHWLVTLEVALMLMIISVAVSLVAVIVLVVTAIPLIITSAVMFETGRLLLSQVMMFVGVLCVLLPLIMAATFIGAYQWVTWTMLYNSLTKRDSVRSKIIRIAERVIPNRHLRFKGK